MLPEWGKVSTNSPRGETQTCGTGPPAPSCEKAGLLAAAGGGHGACRTFLVVSRTGDSGRSPRGGWEGGMGAAGPGGRSAGRPPSSSLSLLSLLSPLSRTPSGPPPSTV